MPKNAVPRGLYAVIGYDQVDVVRLTDQLNMWIDDEGLFNAEIDPLATKLARQRPGRHPIPVSATLRPPL
jgi:hypothetical protein